MFHRFFTDHQLSLFFKKASLMNLLCLLANIIHNRYYPQYKTMSYVIDNFNNLSLFITCIILVSQLIFIFRKNHVILIHRYNFIASTIEIVISTFSIWIVTINNNIEDDITIFFSKASVNSHDPKIMIVLLIVLLLLLINFFSTLKRSTQSIDSIKMIRENVYQVFYKHIFILIIIIGIFNFNKLEEFSHTLLTKNKNSFLFSITILKIIIPSFWFLWISWCFYKKRNHIKKFFKKFFKYNDY